jgi:hypothetical protein
MSIFLSRILAVGLGCLLLQACASPPKRALDDAARQSPQDRESVVVIEQGELHANIEVSHVADATGASAGAIGAIIGAIVDSRVNQNRTDAAETGVTPLRNALIDYDFDHRALQATQATLAKMPGFDSTKVAFSKDGTKDHLLRMIDQSGSSQFLVAKYAYALSPNFSQIVVSMAADIYPKEVKDGSLSDRVSTRDALYTERFWYVESLPHAGKDLNQNAQLWNQNGSQPARDALDAGLAGVESLFIRSMSQTPEAAAALDKGHGTELAGFHGNLVETSEKGTLLYNGETGTWIFVDGQQAAQK